MCKANFEIRKNEQFNSFEIYFDEKPEEATRTALKNLRYRWHATKKCWYGYGTEEALKAALEGKTETAPAAKKEKAEKKNKFGVKVGDFFSCSWGYEQTQNEFFQVIALVGESSVRVREVIPPIIAREAISGMSEDRIYKLDRSELLPPAERSVFINDQEKGDLKRLKSYNQDGSCPQFYLTSYANAYYCTGETEKTYESWYY